jgi:Na+-translocating ferredoxin:NAD+ oxidoreductase RnfG subunit
MKKLFEKPMFHYTFVLTVVAIVCGLLIGGMNAITAPIIQRNLEEAERRAYQEVLPAGQDFTKLTLVSGVPASIQGAVEGKNASNQVVGYIYTASGNNQHGSISIVVSVDATGKILGASILSINQTKGIADTESNLKSFIGAQIGSSNPLGDIISGVTNSLNTVKALLNDISVAHGLLATVPSSPYAALYGEGYVLSDDSTFVPSAYVVKREIVKNASNVEIGYIYTLTGAGDYDNGQEVVSGHTITLRVAFNMDDDVLGIIVPAELYGHTAGNRLTKIQNYVNLLVGKNASEFQAGLSNPGDLVSGVTYTKDLVDILIDALIDEVN